MSRILRKSQDGYVMVTALIALAVMSILAAAAIAQANTALRMSGQAVRSEQALYVANAGLEHALARVRDAQVLSPGEQLSDSLTLEPGVSGAYTVTIAADPDDRFVRVTSTGTVNGEQRVLSARLALPSGSSPVIYQQTVLTEGQVLLSNNVEICGDVISNTRIDISNNAKVWGQTSAENEDSPCDAVNGTGMAVSANAVAVGQNAIVQGGICDKDHWGAGTPCPTKPVVKSVPGVDMTQLKQRATHWYVRSASQCSQRPTGAECTVLSSNLFRVDGPITFEEPALIWVDSELEVPQNGDLRLIGAVTFVATGQIRMAINAKVTCGTIFCPVAFIGASDVMLSNNVEAHASIQAGNQFQAGNNVHLYGNVLAKNSTLSNNYQQTGQPPDAQAFPPGLVTRSGAYTGNSSEQLTVPDGFAGWGD